jgi:hypothetical protein
MNEANIFQDAVKAVLVMSAAAMLFLGSLGGLGFFFTDKAFHAESAALSAASASAPAKDGKAPSKKPARDAKPN